MADKTITIDGTDYVLTKAGQVRINGGRHNTYEVRKSLGGDAWHQLRDIHVPLGRSAEAHLKWVLDDGFEGDFGAWLRDTGGYAVGRPVGQGA